VSPEVPLGDATRRTWLANERTWLAWVRTGLTATGLALAVGKVIPAVDRASDEWAYELLGAGYAIFGVLLVAYGFRRRQEVEEAVAVGGYRSPHPLAITAFTVIGTVLGLLSALVLLFG
jgi:putative membrane protein